MESVLASFGLHVGIIGSCATKGGSDKDVDICIYQRSPVEKRLNEESAAVVLGLMEDYIPGFQKRHWVPGKYAKRLVAICEFNGARVDIMFANMLE